MGKREVVNLQLIRNLRIKKEITIEGMSLLLGYEGYQAYYYKEKGSRKMSAEDIGKIAYVLDVPIKDLFFAEVITEKVIDKRKRVAV